MLADEVGLGKTIEAGVIIRQCLLDHPSERVLVLAPRPLVHQWQEELHNKFGVADFAEQVRVSSFEELEQASCEGTDLLVVDEAHHLIGREGVDSIVYRNLAATAHATRRLLLLSATPVLGNERTYLAMLHLLDPATYRLEDAEAFTARVALRREYADNLVRLRPNQRLVRLEGIKENLIRLFPADDVVQRYAAQIDDQDEVVRTHAIRALKRHIAETYRLQQRLLRTRRKDIAGWELRPRNSALTADVDEDDRVEDACAALEEWRNRATRALDVADDPDAAAHSAERDKVKARYVRLFEAASGGLEQLAAEARRQRVALNGAPSQSFVEDPALLDDLIVALDAEHEGEYDRQHVACGAVEMAISALRSNEPGSVPKLVAFASSTELARSTFDALCKLRTLGRDGSCLLTADMSAEEVADTVEQFRIASSPRVLVCDRAGEEGLNLAFAGAILYLDLPLSPSRMEQRIGRLDRYGRDQQRIRHRFILPSDDEDSPWLAWKEVLEHGFGVFSQSLSEVQFVLDELEQLVTDALFERGADGLRDICPQILRRLEEAREDLDREAELDRMELDQRELSPLFDELDSADTDERRFVQPLANWWHEMLGLSQWRDEARLDTFYLGWGRHALIPKYPWKPAFEGGLGQRLTFRRYQAVRDPDVRLVRPGVPFVDHQQGFLSWDDRGTAFATWRQSTAWPSAERGQWQGFKLTYVVEGNWNGALAESALNTRLATVLRRRLDGLFAPGLHVLHVDLALQEVDDPELLRILAASYCSGGRGEYHDYNLGSRRDALFSVVDPNRWASLCGQVREASETLLRRSPAFQERVRRAVQGAEDELRDQNERLRRRAVAVEAEIGTADVWLAEEIRLNEAILGVVAEPRVRLESIGFIVVTDEAPAYGDVA
jgi:ATP-dependent helicase HepA